MEVAELKYELKVNIFIWNIFKCFYARFELLYCQVEILACFVNPGYSKSDFAANSGLLIDE